MPLLPCREGTTVPLTLSTATVWTRVQEYPVWDGKQLLPIWSETGTRRGELEFHWELWGECLQETPVSRMYQWRVLEGGGGILWNRVLLQCSCNPMPGQKGKSTHQVSNFHSVILLLTKMIRIRRELSWGQQEPLQLPDLLRPGKSMKSGSWNTAAGWMCVTHRRGARPEMRLEERWVSFPHFDVGFRYIRGSKFPKRNTYYHFAQEKRPPSRSSAMLSYN